MMEILLTFPYLAFEYFKTRVLEQLKPGRFFLCKGLYLKINVRHRLLIVWYT